MDRTPQYQSQWSATVTVLYCTVRYRRMRRGCGPPVGRPRGTSPWCPPALSGLTATERGVSVPIRPAKHHGGGSPLRLLPLSPGPHNAHAPSPTRCWNPPGARIGWARRSTGSTSGTVRHPPLGERDAVSRVWALSPPVTTDWAAYGRRVMGAWSVA